MFRIHPEDLQLLANKISENLKEDLKLTISKEKEKDELTTLSVDEVAKIFNVSKYTIYRWINANVIEYSKIGKSYVIPKKSLLKLIEKKNE